MFIPRTARVYPTGRGLGFDEICQQPIPAPGIAWRLTENRTITRRAPRGPRGPRRAPSGVRGARPWARCGGGSGSTGSRGRPAKAGEGTRRGPCRRQRLRPAGRRPRFRRLENGASSGGGETLTPRGPRSGCPVPPQPGHIGARAQADTGCGLALSRSSLCLCLSFSVGKNITHSLLALPPLSSLGVPC